MVLHLAEQLDVPLRDRNILLNAAGFAPVLVSTAAEARARLEAFAYDGLVVDLRLPEHWDVNKPRPFTSLSGPARVR
jgi:hypothetical protein